MADKPFFIQVIRKSPSAVDKDNRDFVLELLKVSRIVKNIDYAPGKLMNPLQPFELSLDPVAQAAIRLGIDDDLGQSHSAPGSVPIPFFKPNDFRVRAYGRSSDRPYAGV